MAFLIYSWMSVIPLKWPFLLQIYTVFSQTYVSRINKSTGEKVLQSKPVHCSTIYLITQLQCQCALLLTRVSCHIITWSCLLSFAESPHCAEWSLAYIVQLSQLGWWPTLGIDLVWIKTWPNRGYEYHEIYDFGNIMSAVRECDGLLFEVWINTVQRSEELICNIFRLPRARKVSTSGIQRYCKSIPLNRTVLIHTLDKRPSHSLNSLHENQIWS